MAGEWQTLALGELARLHAEQVLPADCPEQLYYHFSLPAFDDGEQPVLERGHQIGSNKFTVPAGSVLVSKLNPRIPRVWAPRVTTGLPSVASTEFLVLVPRDDTDSRFLKYACLSPAVRDELECRVTGTSGSHQRVRPEDALSITVGVPASLVEQRAIAHILGTLDDKIELNRRMCQTLEAMARALFKSWFVDFEPVRAKAEGRDPGLPREIADLFPARLVDSELGEIPEGWEVAVLGDVLFQSVDRCSPSAETRSQPYVPIECIAARSLLLAESKPGVDAQSSLTRFRKGELLFGAMRPYFHKVAIAPFDGTTRTTAFVMQPRRAGEFSFATMLLHDARTITYATNHSTGSTIPYAVWQGSLELMPIVLPPAVVRELFDHITRPLLERIPPVFFANQTLAALRDTLLPRLISGDLRIEDAEKFIGSAV